VASPQTPKGRVLVSASIAGTIIDATDGIVVDRASGLSFPNGLALGPDGFLYVAETGLARVSRLALASDGTMGTAEVYATGLPAADGISFDRRGNLLVVGTGTLWVVSRATRAVSSLSTDPLLGWPSNIAFGRGHGFRKKDLFLANFGQSLGNGTTVVRLP
jgi:sugar lactone lactonase YvrE